MTNRSDYRKATVVNNAAWDREMILEKAAYNLETLGFPEDAKILRTLRKGKLHLLSELIKEMKGDTEVPVTPYLVDPEDELDEGDGEEQEDLEK